MLQKIKADLQKHRVSWILLCITAGLVIYLVRGGYINLTRGDIGPLILAMVGSGLLFTGFTYLLKGYKADTEYRQRTEEEIRDIYNNNPTITITLPAIRLPRFGRKDK